VKKPLRALWSVDFGQVRLIIHSGKVIFSSWAHVLQIKDTTVMINSHRFTSVDNINANANTNPEGVLGDVIMCGL
jgi:hypothetical protein